MQEYWVQVEGVPKGEQLEILSRGVHIGGKQPFKTKSCTAKKLAIEPIVPERNPPIRTRISIPTSWISLVLTEGKNRQVRRMTATVNLPTLRLIRYRMGDIKIDMLREGGVIVPGKLLELDEKTVYRGLFGQK